VARAPAERDQLERHALAQRAEGADPVGRDVVGDEQDALQRSASS
jgi:hypothetical protein